MNTQPEPGYELNIVSFVNRSQHLDRWLEAVKSCFESVRIEAVYYDYKGSSKPILHVNLMTLLNNEKMNGSDVNIWDQKNCYQRSLKQVKHFTSEILFCPIDYHVRNGQLFLVGQLLPDFSLCLLDGKRNNFGVMPHSYMPVAQIIRGEERIDFDDLPYLKPVTLDNMALVTKTEVMSECNTFIIEWSNLADHDHHRDHDADFDDD